MMYNQIRKCSFRLNPIASYIEKRTNLVMIENKNPEYKDSVIILKSPNDGCSIPRFSIIIDMVLTNIEFIDLSDTTNYTAGLQSRIRFNLLNFKEKIDDMIKEYNNYEVQK